jgi:hypothetical protein
MKPLHIGLLLAGAAIAGALAVKMTQPPPVPVPARVIQPPVSPAVVRAPPVAVTTPVPKPSPIPIPAAPRIARTAAPEPVYDTPPKSVIHKSKPILPAPVLIAKVKPTQWSPGRYEGPAAAPRAAAPAASTPSAQVATSVPAEQRAVPDPPPSVVKDKPPAPRQVTLQTGMTIPVRLDESLSRTFAGESFQATLVDPLVVNGLEIAERGARVTGRVRINSLLELGLATLSTSDGQRVGISTDPWKYGEAGTIAGGTIIRFRLASKLTITEQQVAGR